MSPDWRNSVPGTGAIDAMRQKALRRVSPGDPINANDWNELIDFVQRNALDVGQSAGLNMRQTPYGTSLAVVDQKSYPYLCQPSSAVSGAAGTWPNITAVSFTADVYTVSGSTMNKFASDATIFTWLAAPLVANKTCWLLQDSSGNFVVIDQSCV
jgi:hypothetical protein